MNCPEHLVIGGRFGYVWMYWRDVPRETIPLRIWLNPLRYEVILFLGKRRLKINSYGAWATRIPFALRRALCRVIGHKPELVGRHVFCERCVARLSASQGQEGGHD